jgi:hypothetical protein
MLCFILIREQAQELSRLVAYRSAGLLGRPPTSTNAERAFEAAKVVELFSFFFRLLGVFLCVALVTASTYFSFA